MELPWKRTVARRHDRDGTAVETTVAHCRDRDRTAVETTVARCRDPDGPAMTTPGMLTARAGPTTARGRGGRLAACPRASSPRAAPPPRAGGGRRRCTPPRTDRARCSRGPPED